MSSSQLNAQPLHCRYHLSGKGIPWVFIHGLLGSGDDWQHVIAHLPAGHNWLCLDLPGHGGSRDVKVSQQAGFAETAALIAACLNQLNIHLCHLVGYSLGGRIAMYFASQYPQYINTLVLESAHPGLTHSAEQTARLSHDQAWATRFAQQPIDHVLTAWYQQGVFDDLTPKQKSALCQIRAHNHGPAIAHMLMATSLGRQANLTPNLQNAKYPIRYFVAENDAKFSAIAKLLTQQVPQLDLQPFPEAGHNIHWAKPLEYAQILEQRVGLQR
ncbi:2-succinyl-6-hydroxy-2,4-cyclohexadiene-1-carboxylate synthase [Motilimonas sp. KMU-193]|uniref:2-succinyl-6-hydroxy-2, 4-cyclohexadiene-1-carboxylate synthase n=1 Tax=Motilimonas sp. KMU-193 TaxID=3388668 RepID=UPI00396B29A0